MPKSYITDLFGTSPIRPLQQHMGKVQACAAELVPFLRAVLADDWDQARLIQQRIVTCEHEADALKKDLRMHLPKGLFMPMARRDVLEVLLVQDRIANRTKDIAGLMIGRRMVLPEAIANRYVEFVERCLDAVAQAKTAVEELDELLETGFRGGEADLVEKMIRNLDQIESETDAMQVQIRALLFDIERELPPVDVIFLYKVIEWTGDLADDAQRVGSRLQLMLAK